MKVKCKFNTGDAFKGYNMPIGFFETSQYPIVIGEEYFVMGMVVYDGLLLYLIDDEGFPTWCPFQLFDIVDNLMVGNWYFQNNISDKIGNVTAIWGYDELCNDANHYIDLIERNPKANEIYNKRKNEFLG